MRLLSTGAPLIRGIRAAPALPGQRPASFFPNISRYSFRAYRRPPRPRPENDPYGADPEQLQQQLQQQRYQTYNQVPYHLFQSQRQHVHPLKKWAQSPRFFYQIGLLGVAAAGIYIYHLEEVPVSGRRRFMIVSPAQEAKIAKDQFEVTLQQFQGKILSEYDPRVRLTRRVMKRLIRAAGLEDKGDWEVFVVAEGIPNAFVIPGGKVFVFTGILPICQTEDALAAVMGHEIAHTLARHSAERLSLAAPLLGLNWLISVFFGIPPAFMRTMLEYAFLMPGSRSQESEADYIGLLMMAQACYNPSSAVGLWTRMEQLAEKQGESIPEFLSTHPSNANRISRIKEWMPEAKKMRDESDCGGATESLAQFWKRLGYPAF